MAKKKNVDLNIAQKKYIDLLLKTTNNVNYDELFARVAAELGIDEERVRDYANAKIPISQEIDLLPLPPENRKEPTTLQNAVRDQFTPARKDPNMPNARHVTVMSDNLAELLKNVPNTSVKGSARHKDCIYRPA